MRDTFSLREYASRTNYSFSDTGALWWLLYHAVGILILAFTLICQWQSLRRSPGHPKPTTQTQTPARRDISLSCIRRLGISSDSPSHEIMDSALETEEQSVVRMLTEPLPNELPVFASHHTVFLTAQEGPNSVFSDRKSSVDTAPAISLARPSPMISERRFKRVRSPGISFYWFRSDAPYALAGPPSLDPGTLCEVSDIYLHVCDTGFQAWRCESAGPTPTWYPLGICGEEYLFPGFDGARVLIITGDEPSWVKPGTLARYRQTNRPLGQPAVRIKIEYE